LKFSVDYLIYNLRPYGIGSRSSSSSIHLDFDKNKKETSSSPRSSHIYANERLFEESTTRNDLIISKMDFGLDGDLTNPLIL
jgi:hypothetical protein